MATETSDSALKSQSLDEDQLQLAKNLANPIDNELRERTVDSLRSYLSSIKSISELNMLKLWKALHYCMWLCDKSPIQIELAERLSGLVHVFTRPKLCVLFLTCFLRTIMREWALLDQHRMNKFYMFYRHMLRQSIAYIHSNKWKKSTVTGILTAFDVEILQKTPNGLRFHTADIFIEEIVTSVPTITTKHFLQCLEPFLRAIQSTKDAVFHDRIRDGVFRKFLTIFARENKKTDQAEGKFLLNVDTKRIQATVFDLAASTESDISERNRSKCYAIHREFRNTTGEEFVNVDGDSATKAEEEEEEGEVPLLVELSSEEVTSNDKRVRHQDSSRRLKKRSKK